MIRRLVIAAIGAICCLSPVFGQLISQQLSISVQSPPSLGLGTYTITNGSLAVDATFATGNPPYVRLNTPNSASTSQQWTWNGSTFKNVFLTANTTHAPGPYLADNGDTTVTAAAVGDAWVPVPGNGFSIKDTTTGFYLINNGGTLAMSGGNVLSAVVSHNAGALCSGTGATTCSSTLTVNSGDNVLVGSGYCLAAGCATAISGNQITSITSSPSLLGTCVKSAAPTSAVVHGVEIWRCPVTSTGTTTISANWSSAVYWAKVMTADVRGLTSAPDDTGNFTTGTGTVSSVSLLTHSPNELIFAYSAPNGGQLQTVGTGYTLVDSTSDGNLDEYNPTNLAGGNTATANMPTSSLWMMAVAGFATTTAPTQIARITTFTAANTFTAASPNAVLGVVAVPAMFPTTQTFTGQLSISGANSCGFHLTSTTPPATVEAGAAGCSATGGPHNNGLYDDWNVVATQTGIIDSPLTQAEAATAVPGSTGCLTGSKCPPGAWVNDLDEHFTGTSLNSSIWLAGTNDAPGGGGLGNCQQSGAMVFNNPGITIFGLPQHTTGPNAGMPNGCWFANPTTNEYTSPGFFEFNVKTDTAPQAWSGGFFEFGPNASTPCSQTIPQNGVEADLVETFISNFEVHWSGYTNGCQQSLGGGSSKSTDGQQHIWGLDYGDNNAITFYVDGVQGWQYAPTGGVQPGTCPANTPPRCANGNWEGQFIFMDFIGLNQATSDTVSNGTTITWVRHYHH